MRQVDPSFPVEQEGQARWYGVYPGKVASVKDKDKQGRVQVELLFGPVVNGQKFSVWARVATLMAGGGRGSFFIPEPGDEVLVAFYAGDVRRPYVIGALWNGQDAPPQQMDEGGQNNIRVVKTRSGHKLEFDDTSGSQKITITTPNGNELILDDGAGGKITLQNSMGASIEFDSIGNIKITAPLKLTIEAAQIEANVPMSQFNGVTQHQTMISSAVVGSTYTPGAGNIW
jgi:uncharacterized protein involved in type VI secretion and phage assembly